MDDIQVKIYSKKITSLYKELQSIRELGKTVDKNPKVFPTFRGRFREVEKIHNEFIKNWDELYALFLVADKEKEFPFEEKYLKSARSFVYECNTTFETIMNPVPTSKLATDGQSNQSSFLDPNLQNATIANAVRSRLPKISLPKFDGELLEWPKFRDLFVSLVHEEPSLPLIEKFHYLIGNVSGEPLRLISSFSITGANYDNAWKALLERYNNKRILASVYLHKIRQFKLSMPSSSNSYHLRSFLKVVADSFTALNSLEIPDEADYLKLQLALDCLDHDTRRLFEEKQHGQEFPKYDALISFIIQRCQILELAESTPTAKRQSKPNTSFTKQNSFTAFVQREASASRTDSKTMTLSCHKCKRNHPLFKCFAFKSMPFDQRTSFVRSNNLCYNCLRPGHFTPKCSSKSTCFHCKGRHHTLLHEFPPSNQPPQDDKNDCNIESKPAENTSLGTDQTGVIGAAAGHKTVLLGTARVNIRDRAGNWQPVRIVVDSGSQFSVITTECARRLGLPYIPSHQRVSGIGDTLLPLPTGVIKCQLRSAIDDKSIITANALAMEELISNLPTAYVSPTNKQYFSGITLADDRFWDPQPVEFLLGADLYLQILTTEPRVKVTKAFGTLPTIFGHIVIGIPPKSISKENTTCLAMLENNYSDNLLTKFWEIEEIHNAVELNPKDKMVEDNYDSTTQRLPSGRYMVALPLIDPKRTYPSSVCFAKSRFLKLESRLSKDPQLKASYCAFMEEYLDLGHMKLASHTPKYVIPHHAVFKRSMDPNVASKIRVVFDASMQTPEGALNENMLAGPKLQQDISTVLLNFRTHRIGFCVDIVKMFRQILIIPEHRPYQAIFWRSSPEKALKLYELQTLTNGQTASSYLAIKTIKRVAMDEGTSFPKAKEVLEQDIYVDNIISGAESLKEALTIKEQLVGLLNKGCFPLHEWACSNKEFRKTLSDKCQENEIMLPPEDSTTSKVLGMHWDCEKDTFSFKIRFNGEQAKPPSKRIMLSVIARLFDPLGLLAPVIVTAKAMIQELWKLRIDWDEALPKNTSETWKIFIEDLPRVTEVNIPRWVRCSLGNVKLFGFCDASEKCYAAAIYVRVEETNKCINTFLLSAKTRLAPVKSISVPRLELCAAYLLVKLLKAIKETKIVAQTEEVYLFSDSTVVLSWLRLHPQELKTFVANRVSYIIANSELRQWRHVPSAQNPADIASRGCLPSSLINNNLWWYGPDWTRRHPLEMPPMPAVLQDVPEKKSPAHVLIHIKSSSSYILSFIQNYSKFSFMLRTFAYILRFVNNCKSRIKGKSNSSTSKLTQLNDRFLTAHELEGATEYLIKEVQQAMFSNEFDFERNTCKSKRLKSLMVFLDSSGLLRVGGRLANSLLSYDNKHPILLPRESYLTEMLIDYHHQNNFHLGAKALQAHITRKYYIFKIRSLIRKRIWKCLRCYKLKAKPNNPLMADLPLSRVNQGQAFISVGVDFAGPYFIKEGQRRNAPTSKAYMCIFICMSVKAVHIEVVSSLSTQAFLAAFSRFVARRGLPSEINSDCGTNFIGAARHLKELYKWYNNTNTQEVIQRHCSNRGIHWKFNPPAAPHFGGLWEAAVKSAKAHLRRTLGDRAFYLEELITVFTRIEAVLNSRPLCSVTANPNDFDYLTPGHFLIGAPLTSSPERDITKVNVNRLRRWQLLQASIQTFWKRWSSEYIQLLQKRTKWTSNTPPIKSGDLVLIQDSSHHPLHWKLGRVTSVFPDKQGVVRVASVKTAAGEFKRPVHRLAPLEPINNEE